MSAGGEEEEDWIDMALKAGQGFKSEQEKEEYMKAIGDPFKHPMFATSAEDLAGNPLADAIRALKEEDKTLVQIAVMYKDEGNLLLKKKTPEAYTEAFSSYTDALSFVDQAVEAREAGSESPEDSQVDLGLLKSQILSNRALVCLNKKNYGSCIRDASDSIVAWSLNVKAHYRKAKAWLELRRYEDCVEACRVAESMIASGDMADISALAAKAREEMALAAAAARQREERLDALRVEWTKAWEDISSFNMTLSSLSKKKKTASDPVAAGATGKICLGFALNDTPSQLLECYPSKDESGLLAFPVLLLYPQHNQLDVIQSAGISNLLAEYLAEMFPELEAGVEAVPWDVRKEYQVSSLVAYVLLQTSPQISSCPEWLESCLDRRCAEGLEGSEAAESSRKKQAERVSTFESTAQTKTYVEVHLGCSLQQLMQIPGYVVSGGIVTLVVYVRGNQSHTDFLSTLRADRSVLLKLQPHGVISKIL